MLTGSSTYFQPSPTNDPLHMNMFKVRKTPG
jgi:hypothetical protein